MCALNQAMMESGNQLRADVWWTLFDDLDQHSPEDEVGGSRIVYLLTPIPDRMSFRQIAQAFPDETIPHWLIDIKHDNSPTAKRIAACLDAFDGAAASSRKRKRDPEKVEEVLQMLKREFPDMKLASSKDILPGLTALVKR
jgi:hypothetical protein